MRTKIVAAGAGLLALGATLLITPVAGATAPPPTLGVSPDTVLAGQTVEFHATCYGTPSELTSPGLAAPVALEAKGSPDFVGRGRAGNRPGHFTASFKCSASSSLPAASGTATVEFTVVCAPPPMTTSKPSSTPPPTTSTSEPTSSPEPSTTTTSKSPDGSVAPAASTSCSPTGTTAPTTAPQRPQVAVKPKGAPETGDGSIATS